MKILERVRKVWGGLQDKPISPWKGYLFFGSIIVAICMSVWIGQILYKENQILEIISEDPGNFETFSELADIYWDIPWIARGIYMFQELSSQYPDVPAPLIELAGFRWKQDNNTLPLSTKIETHLNNALNLTNIDEESLSSIARLFLWTKEFKEAEKSVNQAILQNPESSRAYYLLGYALKRQGKVDLARENFQHSILAGDSDDPWAQLSQAELLDSSRHFTFTLASDLEIDASLIINSPSKQTKNTFSQLSDSQWQIRNLIWGETYINKAWRRLNLYSYRPNLSITQDKISVSQETFMPYLQLWDSEQFIPFSANSVSIENLPLINNNVPITFTIVVSEPYYIANFSPAPTQVETTKYTWIITDTATMSPTINFDINPERFDLSTYIFTNDYLYRIAAHLPWSLAIIASLIVFIRARIRSQRNNYVTKDTKQVSGYYKLFYFNTPLSWGFDISLIFVSFFAVIQPLILILINPSFVYLPVRNAYLAYVILLGILFLRIASLPAFFELNFNKTLVEIGFVIFVFFFAIRLGTYVSVRLFTVIAAWPIYSFILIRNHKWLIRLNISSLQENRQTLIEQAASLHSLIALKDSLSELDNKLAKNQIKPTDYEESKKLLKSSIQEKEILAKNLREHLSIPDSLDIDETLLSVGPNTNPLRNAIFAVILGLIPYFTFLILDWQYGASWDFFSRGFTIDAFYELVFSLATMTWGPIFIIFFGYYFQVLLGRRGVTKALIYSFVLILLFVISRWLVLWRDISAIEIMGESLRVAITYLTVGIAMDFATVNMSWRRFRSFYDSPIFAALLAVLIAIITTVTTAVITGSLSELVTIFIGQISTALTTGG